MKRKIRPYGFFCDLPTSGPGAYEVCALTHMITIFDTKVISFCNFSLFIYLL